MPETMPRTIPLWPLFAQRTSSATLVSESRCAVGSSRAFPEAVLPAPLATTHMSDRTRSAFPPRETFEA